MLAGSVVIFIFAGQPKALFPYDRVAIIWKPFFTIVTIAATTIAESPISAGRYDRWRVVSI